MNLFDEVVAKFRAVYPVSWHIGKSALAFRPTADLAWVDGQMIYLDAEQIKARRIITNEIEEIERKSQRLGW